MSDICKLIDGIRSIGMAEGSKRRKKIQRELAVEMSHPSKQQCISSATTILDLNDDVLRETFQYVGDLDLSDVANVCPAFKRNALAEFSQRYKLKCFGVFYRQPHFLYPVNWRNDLSSRQKVCQLLRNFGSSISSFQLYLDEPLVSDHSHKLVEIFTQYFGATLTELELWHIEFSADMIPRMRPLLSRLRKLKLASCRWKEEKCASEILLFCSEMHTLEIVGTHTWPFATPIGFLKLKSFAVSKCLCSEPQNEAIARFLKVNSQLKEIEIWICKAISFEIIPAIANNVPKVEKVILHSGVPISSIFMENAKHLSRLPALKTLEIDCEGTSVSRVISRLVQAGVSLKSLSLTHVKADKKLINGIIKMKALKQISLRQSENLELSDVFEIVKNLREITDLCVRVHLLPTDLVEVVGYAPKMRNFGVQLLNYDSDWKLDENVYLRILDVVKGRKEKCPLELWLELARVEVPVKIRTANQKIFNARGVEL